MIQFFAIFTTDHVNSRMQITSEKDTTLRCFFDPTFEFLLGLLKLQWRFKVAFELQAIVLNGIRNWSLSTGTSQDQRSVWGHAWSEMMSDLMLRTLLSMSKYSYILLILLNLMSSSITFKLNCMSTRWPIGDSAVRSIKLRFYRETNSSEELVKLQRESYALELLPSAPQSSSFVRIIHHDGSVPSLLLSRSFLLLICQIFEVVTQEIWVTN